MYLILENTISLLGSHGVKIILILAVAFMLHILSRYIFIVVIRKLVGKQSDLDQKAEVKREDTLIKVFVGTFRAVLWVVVGMMILSELSIDIGPLLAGAGLVGVAIGFGAQYLVRDVISGLFLVFENQYRVGDYVCLNDTCGTVEDITLRITVLRDGDGVVHTVPNGEVKITSNKSKDFAKVNVKVGVSYEVDIEKASEIMNRIGNAIADEEEWKDKIHEAPQFLRVSMLGDSAVELHMRGQVAPLAQWSVAGELRRRIKEAFAREGIEIPYPHMVIEKK